MQFFSQSPHLNQIARYYRECNNAYRDAWGLDKNMQLNLGLWKSGCRSLSEALKNLNQEVAEKAIIKSGDRILDAGCGVGGTAIFLAQNYGCRIKGITLSAEQVEQARKNARKHQVDHLCDFEVMDYNHTTFEKGSFDVILGIESICYAESKFNFLKEVKRLLKKGGRLVLAENVQAKPNLSAKEHQSLYEKAFFGCQVKSLDTAQEYEEKLSQLQFKRIRCEDYTDLIRPSISRLRRIYYPAKLYNLVHRWMGKPFSEVQEANTRMCFHLQSSLNSGLWKYAIISATYE